MCGLIDECRAEGIEGEENCIARMKEKWTVNFKFTNDDIEDEIIEIEIEDEYYTLLLLRYAK